MEKIPNSIPLSKLNRGYAGKVLDEISKTNEPSIIIKNNIPVAVIVPINLYNEMSINTYRKPVDLLRRGHYAAGSLSKYANKSLVGKEEDLYHEALDKKYGK